MCFTFYLFPITIDGFFVDQRIDEIDEQRAVIFGALFNLKNISSQTTKLPPIPLATIKIPKVIGEREKKAYKKLQGICVDNYLLSNIDSIRLILYKSFMHAYFVFVSAIDVTNDAVKITIVILFGAGLVVYFFHSLKQVIQMDN